MAAIRTDSTLGTNFTQATLFAAIKAAMTSAGFSTSVDDYTSGTDRIAVYTFVTDASKTYGTIYYRIRLLSNFTVLTGLYTTWNTITHTGNSASNEISFTGFVATNSVNFTTLNGGTEYKFVFVTQGSTFVPLGIIAPVNRPNWWNLNNWHYAFMWQTSTLNAFAGSTTNPYSNNLYTLLLNSSLMLNSNQQTGNTDILTELILLSNSGRGIAGKSSDDLGLGCLSASSRYNTIPTDNINQNFLVINPVAAGLVVKI